jgi:hypothetical protein
LQTTYRKLRHSFSSSHSTTSWLEHIMDRYTKTPIWCMLNLSAHNQTWALQYVRRMTPAITHITPTISRRNIWNVSPYGLICDPLHIFPISYTQDTFTAFLQFQDTKSQACYRWHIYMQFINHNFNILQYWLRKQLTVPVTFAFNDSRNTQPTVL